MDTVEEFTQGESENGHPASAAAEGGDSVSGSASGWRQWTAEEWREWDEQRWGARGSHHSDAWGAAAIANGTQTGSLDPWTHWRSHNASWQWQSAGWDKQTKGDFSDPPAWGGWSNYRLWKRALVRWDSNTDVLLRRRSEKILKSFDWELQSELDHISDQDLQSETYLQNILAVLDVLAGEKEESEKRRCVRAALYEGPRRSEESLAQYSLRREAQFSAASKFIELPNDLKAFMLEDQAGLSRQNLQNLRSLTGGSTEFSKVIRALQVLDVDDEPIVRAKQQSTYLAEPGDVKVSAEDDIYETDDEQPLDDVEINAFLCSVMKDDLDEEQAMNYLADWSEKRRRTWAENKNLKNARKKDRRHFDDVSSRPSKPANLKGRMPIAQLKAITRCSNCGVKGHWREDCTAPYKPKSERLQGGRSTSSTPSAFVFLGLGEKKTSNFPGWSSYFNFLEIPPGCAIVDPGASQDLIGLKAYEKLCVELEKKGLKTVRLEEDPGPASGIGGSAKTLFKALAPCFLAGCPGVIKLTVIEEDVPHLLSIGLLEHTKAVIDTGRDVIQFQALGHEVPMKRLESGHRILDVTLGAKPFSVPPQVMAEYQLTPEAFQVSHSDGARAYMAAVETPSRLLIQDLNFEVHMRQGKQVNTTGVLGFNWVTMGHVTSNSCHVICQDININRLQGTEVEHVECRHCDAVDTWTIHVHTKQPIASMSLSESCDILSKIGVQHSLKKFQSRFPYSRFMLRFLILCFFSSILPASHAVLHEAGRAWQEPQRKSPGDHASSLVHSGEQTFEDHHGAFQHQDGFFDHSTGVSTPRGSGCLGLQSIWPLEKVPAVQEATFLSPIRAGQPETGLQESIQGVSSCCNYKLGDDGQDQEDGRVCCQGFETGGVCHSPGDAGIDEGPGGPDLQHPDSHNLSAGAVPADAATADGQCDDGEPSSHRTCPGDTADAGDSPEFQFVSERRAGGERYGDVESQSVGSSAAPMTLRATLAAHGVSSLSSEFSGELDHWFVFPFWSAHRCSSFVASSSYFLWKPPGESESLCVWHSPSMYRSFQLSADQDDREFQVPRKAKRNLCMHLEQFFQSSDGFTPVCTEKQLNNSAEETPELQKAFCHNNTVETLGLQEAGEPNNNAARTQEPEETNGPSRVEGFRTNWEIIKPFKEALKGSWSLVTSNGPGTGLPRLSTASAAMGEKSLGRSFKICELFSVPRLSNLNAPGVEFTRPTSFDIKEGWDFFDAGDRAAFWNCLRSQQPDLVTMSPECKPFSVLMHSNWNRMDPGEARRLKVEGMAMFQFCVQVAEFQISQGRYFWIEQPASASSWATHAIAWLLRQPGVCLVQFDQCAAGLSVVPGKLSRKATAFITNHIGIIHELSALQCAGDHEHQPLQSGLPDKAKTYPEGLLRAIIRGVKWQLRKEDKLILFLNGMENVLDDEQEVGGDEDPDMEESKDALRAPQTPSPAKAPDTKLTGRQREVVAKLHVNMGHIPVEQMLTLLKASGAKEEVREYVKNSFRCDICSRQRKPIERKRATFPRTFSFNKIVGIDFFYISFLNKTHAFLNVVDQGSNLQQVALLPNYVGGPPNAKDAWELFCKLWISPFGLPEVLLCDQGSEFKGHFERSLEQLGILQAVTDSASPWQNGRVERHGAWVKQRLEEEVQSGQEIVRSSKELETLAVNVVAHKNKWFHRGGFSPYQLVFGVNPRVPLELLSDDQMIVPGLADASVDPFEADTPAAEFARAHQVRQRARELCVASNLKDKVRLSLSQRMRPQRTWSRGQWVYVYRKFPGTGSGHMTRSRWVGPGLVIIQDGHSVWVSMRSRIWKCSSDQLRAANHMESLGAELIGNEELSDVLEQVKGKRAGAVDVESEGTPPSEAWDQHSQPTMWKCQP